jgi:hypothetical protein
MYIYIHVQLVYLFIYELIDCSMALNPLNQVRKAVSKNKRRFTALDFNLDLSYVTSRIIAMGFPSDWFECK